MKKLLLLSLSLILSVSLVAGPLDTFYIKINKITKDLKDGTINPAIAAKAIHSAREELYGTGGFGFKSSQHLNERIEQIKKESPAFATELEDIEEAIKDEITENKIAKRSMRPLDQIVKAYKEKKAIKAKAAVENAKKAVEDLLPKTEAWLPMNTDYIKAPIIKQKEDQIATILENFRQAIEAYEKTGANNILEMKKEYNFYPLEINRQILTEDTFKINRNEANKAKTITLIDYNIDKLFTFAKTDIIIQTDRSQALTSKAKKTKDQLKVEARKTLGL